MAGKKSYGRKLGIRWRVTKRGRGKRQGGRQPGDNPKIRQKHNERMDISLNEHYEVDYARNHGQIKVSKNGAVRPVRGKTHVTNGRVVRNS
ncbi:MAG: hypothetical protein JRN15_08015 [Nitrososphaerota archaeon]|nr:hypothetical protein [Nitrososphaerota archaeon]